MGAPEPLVCVADVAVCTPAEHLLAFLDDEDNVAKVDEDDLETARGVVEGVVKWLDNNEDALMGDYLLKQFELEAELLPVMYKYLGSSAQGSLRALFAL